ncbi:hypothetical protein THASP1DRAFT_18903 [Thamnocephalis sphaerospora]|uniref:Transmembrane protein 135 N-terminal domain-containing protein n=1 Tax=Thamnocephalis sphaerospora TaxID=78915 RepID=A0A4P9XK25_9FUNG|nr:hypothetical protein THASP1DRAFT_18903 [Thamnocephalis sphaerospora]|eukprot:RKP06105.1 hypothetical protein THASP1DRAFT_18903 [Thamnocephalis sphaerospora]
MADPNNSYYSLLAASPFSWENFLEVFAQLTSYALTDRETETIISSFHAFHARLKRLSNNNLRRLAEEASSSEYGKPQCRHEGKTCVQNALRGYIKAFVVGYGVKFLTEAVPGLLTGRLVKRPSLLKQMGGRDTIYFGMFLSGFIGTYKAILCSLRHLRKQHGSDSGDQLNAFIAGTIAGLALCLERNRDRRFAIALYLTTRSAQFTCVWLANRWSASRARKRRGLMRFADRLDAWLRRWAGTMLMAVASSQILFAYIIAPQTLPVSVRPAATLLVFHAHACLDTSGSNCPADIYSTEHIKYRRSMLLGTLCLHTTTG